MLRLSTICMILAVVAAQGGYEYNRPNRPFGTSSSRPGTSNPSYGSSTTPYPFRPQNDDDYNGPTTGYPNQGYPGSSSQRPGYQGYPGQGPSGSSDGYPGQDDSGNYPGSSDGYSGPSSPGYPGSSGPSGNYPGNSYPGSRGPARYPGSNFGGVNYGDGDTGNYEGGDYSAIPGEPDIDYPILSYIPQTSFDCRSQAYPGYYSDVETRCQVFHVCANNNTYDFLCPNGTVFSQEDFVCVWWNQFECESAPNLYELNAKIYDYSIRGSDDFPLTNFNVGPSYSGRPSYPGSGNQRPSTYPGSSGPYGPSTPYPGGSSYPSSPSVYPGSQGPSGDYPSTQGTLDDITGYAVPGSYPSGPQGPPGSPDSGSRYPGSRPGSNYPGSNPNNQRYPSSRPGTNRPTTNRPNRPGSGSQGYPSGRPNGPGFQDGSNRGRPSQSPNREYLPPRN